MRQLKNFMKAKKPMWNCGECKCITLQCRRNNDEFCSCDGGISNPEVTWDEDRYNDSRWLEGANLTFGFTINPADTTVTASTENGYFTVTDLQNDYDNHYSLSLSSVGGPEQASLDSIYIIDEATGTSIAEIHIYAVTTVETISGPTPSTADAYVGGAIYLSFTYTPENASVSESIQVTSDDYNVAQAWVTSYGSGHGQLGVSGITEGQTIVNYGIEGQMHNVSTTVGAHAETLMDLDTSSIIIGVGETDANKTFTYTPTDAVFGSITCQSSDSSIATATAVKDSDGNGHIEVVGVGPGETYVNIGNDWIQYSSFTVTVS